LAFKTANTEQQATLCHFWQAARGKESPGSEEHSQLAAQNAIPSGELRFGISKLAQFLWQGLWFLIFFILVAADLLVGKYQRIVSEPNLTTGNMQLATLQLATCNWQHCSTATLQL